MFDFGVLVSDQHSTLPIMVASLFALGIWLLFLRLGKGLYILVFPNCEKVALLEDGARSAVPFSTGPDVSPVV